MLANSIDSAFKAAKAAYNSDDPSAFDRCVDLVAVTLEVLRQSAYIRPFGNFYGGFPVAYHVADASSGPLSRPIRAELFVPDARNFQMLAEDLRQYLQRGTPLQPGHITAAVYTAVMSFGMAIDLWNPGARKTPGTFFEFFIGSCCRLKFSGYDIKKHIRMPAVISDDPEAAADIPIEDGRENGGEERTLSGNFVSTDLVIERPDGSGGAVIPLKITTRERIVQPFAHQRILDSAYPGRYRSFLACISEVQRDDKTTSVKQVCVPGTVALFQAHLSNISGIYYCDIPQRYGQADFRAVVPVGDYTYFFDDIEAHLTRLNG
ncbi:hypothetical protein ACM64Y_14895 [Novispirillum sp. DQ9]|uniref:hypothetical protein n=1 Tax=Novispirillum sp. DQ9 TaxID=3398612 RepID=UPI003C7B4F85